MRDAQKPDHVSLSTLVERLREGRYVIPDFQREFEWEPWDIRELMRSIFLDYYIGSLLLWRGSQRSYDDLSCEPVYGHDGSGSRNTSYWTASSALRRCTTLSWPRRSRCPAER
jgi:hypothetical protein